jgi:type I restriction enzyme R subunit
MDDDTLLFRREGGGWPRLNQLFAVELDQLLHEFHPQIWAA